MASLRRIFFYFSLAAGALFVVLTASVFLFKDQIIDQFVREVNKQINTPVKIGSVDVSWWADFPKLSIVFRDVYMEDSHAGIYPLFTADMVSFQLKVPELVRGSLVVHGLHINGSETQLKIDADGVNNYTIVHPGAASGPGLTFALQNVRLENTLFRYADQKANEAYVLSSEQLLASISTEADVYAIKAKGQLHSEQIRLKNLVLFEGKTFSVDSDLVYDDLKKKLRINPSELGLRQSVFVIEGDYQWKEKNLIDLTTRGKNANIQTLLSLLPEKVSRNFTRYRSKGDMYFDATLKGEISAKTSPSLSAKFGFRNATLYHPDYNSQIQQANMEGSFASSHVADPSQAVLVLKNINGTLNGRPFHANLNVRSFTDPDIQLDFKGELDAASVADFYPLTNVSQVKGNLIADFSFQGRVSWMKKRATATKASTKGSIELRQLSLTYGEDPIAIRGINGNLQFNNNDLALSDVTATVGNSDFRLNGFFKNVITFLLFENQPIGIETDLRSDHLDLDELFALGFSADPDGKSTGYAFSLSKNINLNFNCQVRSLKYRRFNARDVRGDLLVKNQMAVTRGIKLRTMGGQLDMSAVVDAKNPAAISVGSQLNLNGIYLDSIFYVFENFNQSFIEDRHLKGQAYADVTLDMNLSPALKLFSETLVADIGVVIKNGELNDFDPLKKLDKYLDDEGLNRVRFLDLKNEVHIENKRIYLPQMEVQTNVTNITISGTHTLDQQIDYRLVAPLRSYRKINLGEAGSAFQSSGGQSRLYLKIAGTTDNYRVVYDAESVKKKIVNDLKQEVVDLKEAFKTKGKQNEKDLELEEEAYFDWDEQP